MAETHDNAYWLARLKEPLSNLGLSEPVYNELHTRGLRTIEHLLTHTEVEIYKVVSGPKKIIMEELRSKKLPMGIYIENAEGLLCSS